MPIDSFFGWGLIGLLSTVSKNSGGDATYAKIVAARELGIPVVMVQRSPIPAVEQVDRVEGAIAWLISQ
jgi:precorrin-6A/cobalt-precorrin-6A reductase